MSILDTLLKQSHLISLQAQESPEPLYDISDCGLKNVPSGVYIKVKMMLKEALLLQVICLSNAIVVCKINAKISSHTECTFIVLNQKYLYIQDNELTALNGGGTISDMSSCLQVLDLHNNHLEKLPDDIGSLKQLKVRITIIFLYQKVLLAP